ncbi:MAG: hypothetical protein Q7S68_00625, partial [Deltaproteobacteria bacterium]|nr:hypothetical protein [Deltaproteobacteria bacterium]
DRLTMSAENEGRKFVLRNYNGEKESNEAAAAPADVKRYFCRRLLGLLGMGGLQKATTCAVTSAVTCAMACSQQAIINNLKYT